MPRRLTARRLTRARPALGRHLTDLGLDQVYTELNVFGAGFKLQGSTHVPYPQIETQEA